MRLARFSMLSRGKLVQDWRRRLAAAEADGAEASRLAWLYKVRARLYRFLLSCYRDSEWRADEPSVSAEDTLAEAPRGDTTTLLDCPLDGKPARHPGKMQAVLKSVSAAQDHPAEAGPLLHGIAADEWVVAVSRRDKLKMAGCQELLRQFGIASTWTMLGEIRVRLFDLERATRLIRDYRDSLKIKPQRPTLFPRHSHSAISPWPVCLAAVLFSPICAISLLLFTQGELALVGMPLLEGPYVGVVLAIFYFASLVISVLHIWFRKLRRYYDERREIREAIANNEKLPES